MQFNQYSIYALFYTEESDSDGEDSNSVGGRHSSEDVGEPPVGDAVAEIEELETTGINDTLPRDESVDVRK